MAKLWEKSQTRLHPFIEKYTVADDQTLDKKLMPYDIQATTAHIKMLQRIKILTEEELERLLLHLKKLLKICQKKDFKIEEEDCHTVIENYLTEKLGDIGKKVHTGRSRNDQVLAALRLLIKDHLGKIKKEVLLLSKNFSTYAKKYHDVSMPGYTHTQQAMPSSVGLYMENFAESLADDAEFLEKVLDHINKNPLGSAAGYGVKLPIDREYTTAELGFKKLQKNPLYCQNSRGKFESTVLESLVQIMLTLGKFANDIILFTSQEFDFFKIPDELTTGSSIMPHKKNMDALEMLRGYVSVIINNQHMIQDIGKNLFSGYNRDFQLMKKPLLESLEITFDSIKVVKIFLQKITPKPKNMAEKTTPGIFMTDQANKLVIEKKMPFRDAYKTICDR